MGRGRIALREHEEGLLLEARRVVPSQELLEHGHGAGGVARQEAVQRVELQLLVVASEASEPAPFPLPPRHRGSPPPGPARRPATRSWDGRRRAGGGSREPAVAARLALGVGLPVERRVRVRAALLGPVAELVDSLGASGRRRCRAGRRGRGRPSWPPGPRQREEHGRRHRGPASQEQDGEGFIVVVS